jgi:hypothetical protein
MIGKTNAILVPLVIVGALIIGISFTVASESNAQRMMSPTHDPSAAALTCIPDQTISCLTIQKLVVDPDGVAGSQLNDLVFVLQVDRNDGGIETVRLRNGNTAVVPVLVNDVYTVTEVTLEDPNTGFTFRSDFGPQCQNVRVSPNVPYSCTVTNTLNRGTLPVGDQPTRDQTLSGVDTTKFASITPQAGTSSAAGATLGLINPPFDTCFGNTDAAAGVSTSRGDRNVIRAPNAATYTAAGQIDLDDVSDALDEFNTKTLSIQIYSDLITNDPVSLAISNPQFKGRVVVEDRDGVKHELVTFNLDTLRTECKFISIAKPAGNAPDKNVYPLGVVGKNKDTSPSKIDEILIQQKLNLLATIESTNFIDPALNPPFAVCQTEPAGASQLPQAQPGSDDVAIYNIRGDINNLGAVYGDKLNVELTVDLNLDPNDLAKITGNNNPFIRVNLVADEDEDSAHKIPFTIQDLWTDCKDMALNREPIFTPIQSEIPP